MKLDYEILRSWPDHCEAIGKTDGTTCFTGVSRDVMCFLVWAVYRRDIRNRLAHGVDPSKAERLREAIAIGTEGFVRAIKKQAGGGGRETSGKRQLRRQCSIDEILHTVEQVYGGIRQAWMTHRGGDGKTLAMWAVRRYGGLTLRETGEALGGVDYAAVGSAIKRLERKAATDRNLRKQIELIGTMLNVET